MSFRSPLRSFALSALAASLLGACQVPTSDRSGKPLPKGWDDFPNQLTGDLKEMAENVRYFPVPKPVDLEKRSQLKKQSTDFIETLCLTVTMAEERSKPSPRGGTRHEIDSIDWNWCPLATVTWWEGKKYLWDDGFEEGRLTVKSVPLPDKGVSMTGDGEIRYRSGLSLVAETLSVIIDTASIYREFNCVLKWKDGAYEIPLEFAEGVDRNGDGVDWSEWNEKALPDQVVLRGPIIPAGTEYGGRTAGYLERLQDGRVIIRDHRMRIVETH